MLKETLPKNKFWKSEWKNKTSTPSDPPYLAPNTTYYFLISRDLVTPDPANYPYAIGTADDRFPGGASYNVAAPEAWSPFGGDIGFELYGKWKLEDGEDERILSHDYTYGNWDEPAPHAYPIRSSSSDFRVAQGFTTGATGFYVSRIVLTMNKIGTPSGEMWLWILSDDDVYATVGASSIHNSANVSAGQQTFQWDTSPSTDELEANAEGIPIPELWGEKANITPVCVNTSLVSYTKDARTIQPLTYKISNRALTSISSIQADTATLAAGADYWADLPNGEFYILGSPLLEANTYYHFVIEGDYSPDLSNYIYFVGSDGDEYGDGFGSEIDNGDNWKDPSSVPPISHWDMGFTIWGRTNIGTAEDSVMVNFQYTTPRAIKLLDTAARTKLGMKFKTGATAFYLSKISLPIGKDGTVAGNIRIAIYNADHSATVGTKSGQLAVAQIEASSYDIPWSLRGTPSKIVVTAKTGDRAVGGTTLDMEKSPDIIRDVFVNVFGGKAAQLETSDFNDLKDPTKGARTEKISVYLDREVEFAAFIERLEAGQLFKFLPTLSGKYTVKYADAGVPASSVSFFDNDYLSFSMTREWKSVFQTVKVKFNELPEDQTVNTRDAASRVAEILYRNKEVLTVETWLKDGDDAATCALKYRSLLEYPRRVVKFSVAGGKGDQLLPMDTVKLFRTRADYEGGTLDGVLFRIFEVSKNAITGVISFTAVLDVQTWMQTQVACAGVASAGSTAVGSLTVTEA